MNILVLSPHTDDIELGCGGSLTKWVEEGHNLLIVVFSLCEDSILDRFDDKITEREFKSSMKELRSEYKIYPFQVRTFPECRQHILESLIKLKKGFKPDLVVGTSLNDTHQDHKTIAEEMRRAFRCSVISYEMPYTTLNFNPQYYIALDKKHLENKMRLLSNYKSQIEKGKAIWTQEYQFGLAKIRGAQIDKEYAEAFEVIRIIE